MKSEYYLNRTDGGIIFTGIFLGFFLCGKKLISSLDIINGKYIDININWFPSNIECFMETDLVSV